MPVPPDTKRQQAGSFSCASSVGARLVKPRALKLGPDASGDTSWLGDPPLPEAGSASSDLGAALCTVGRLIVGRFCVAAAFFCACKLLVR